LVAVTLAFGVLMLAAIDVHAAVVCEPNGYHRYYPHPSQWPVGQSGKYHNTAPWGCAMVGSLLRGIADKAMESAHRSRG
jgi:hypothetical protein